MRIIPTARCCCGLRSGAKAWCRGFRGMFAFVIFDRRDRSLFAARDMFGIKPFYYTFMGESFIFGSEIKSF
ncbi:MAG: hypothetical protein ACLR56_02320 [Oscillospiraceae bacterium]